MQEERKIYQNKLLEFKFRCHENWEEMTQNEKGRFCNSCKKSIYDFRNDTPKAISNFIADEKVKGNEVCGIFSPSQIQPYAVVYARKHKTYHPSVIFALAVFMAFGSTLFSCGTAHTDLMGAVEITSLRDSLNGQSDSLSFNSISLTDTTSGPNPQNKNEPVNQKICIKKDLPKPTENPEMFMVGEAISGEPIEILTGIPTDHYEDQRKIHEIVEETAKFPEGEEALMRYISSEINYPDSAIKNDLQGKVYLKLLIDENGKLESADVARGEYAILNNEALRVIQAIPQWIPAKISGKPVASYYLIPVVFRLK